VRSSTGWPRGSPRRRRRLGVAARITAVAGSGRPLAVAVGVPHRARAYGRAGRPVGGRVAVRDATGSPPRFVAFRDRGLEHRARTSSRRRASGRHRAPARRRSWSATRSWHREKRRSPPLAALPFADRGRARGSAVPSVEALGPPPPARPGATAAVARTPLRSRRLTPPPNARTQRAAWAAVRAALDAYGKRLERCRRRAPSRAAVARATADRDDLRGLLGGTGRVPPLGSRRGPGARRGVPCGGDGVVVRALRPRDVPSGVVRDVPARGPAATLARARGRASRPPDAPPPADRIEGQSVSVRRAALWRAGLHPARSRTATATSAARPRLRIPPGVEVPARWRALGPRVGATAHRTSLSIEAVEHADRLPPARLSRPTRRLVTATNRVQHLGAGITNVPAAPVADPRSAVLRNRSVREEKRFCSSCGAPVGRAREGKARSHRGLLLEVPDALLVHPEAQGGRLVGGPVRRRRLHRARRLGWHLPRRRPQRVGSLYPSNWFSCVLAKCVSCPCISLRAGGRFGHAPRRAGSYPT